MSGVLARVVPAQVPSASWAAIAWLLGGVALGVVTYVLAIGAMWWGAGRPNGAELMVIERAAGELRRRFGAKSAEQA